MNIPAEFDEIRPYAPEELPQVFEELIADPMFKAVVGQVMPGIPFGEAPELLLTFKGQVFPELCVCSLVG
mgnify:CR=1 FL=1